MSRTQSILAKHRIRPKKRLGQNFLFDESALYSIVKAADITSEDRVLEIGAGIGNLSAFIAEKAGTFYALEKDASLKKILTENLSPFTNTQIIFADILDFGLASPAQGKKLKIIGNLPYYITSPILLRLIEQKNFIESILITVQKEVAQRIVAKPGTKDYGRLSCLLQFHCEASILAQFSRRQFTPRPDVDSTLVRLRILEKPSVNVVSEQIFFQTVKAIFAQRRKTLLNGLCAGNFGLEREKLKEILQEVNIDAGIRGEKLSLAEIGKLSDKINSKKNT